MRIVDMFGTAEFRLHDVYRFEDELRTQFPANQNIRAKLRQQLQVLRDADIINFLGRGRYRSTDQSGSDRSGEWSR